MELESKTEENLFKWKTNSHDNNPRTAYINSINNEL